MQKITLFIVATLTFLLSTALWSSEVDKLYQPKISELAQKQQWHNLMHYRPSFLGGVRSQAAGETFFFSARGKSNPEEELEETYRAFLDDIRSDGDESSICRFPARYLFLSRYIEYFEKERLLQCSGYRDFFGRLDAAAVALVFSSYYLNSPASAYGHTLLRFMKNPDEQGHQHQLLDYAVNYAANVTTDNAFLYALFGLTGVFSGEFASMPYFYKLREYSDFESRDIWSYQLEMTEDQIEILIAHIWEMRQTHFRYYYLTQNCSYHMLSILDVANPEWELVSRNPYFVIPVDTIRTVVETTDLEYQMSFHPSKLRESMARVDLVKVEHRKLLSDFLKSENSPKDIFESDQFQGLDVQNQVLILDAAIDMIDFKYAEDILFTQKKWHTHKNEILGVRSQLGRSSTPLEVVTPREEIPHLGHGSRRLSLSSGFATERREFLSLGYRFAYHDHFDPGAGYFQNSSIEMANFEFRFFPDDKRNQSSKKVRLERFSLINVHNAPPYRRYFFSPSWNIDMGVRTYRDDEDGKCLSCRLPYLNFGAGVSFEKGGVKVTSSLQFEALVGKKIGRRGFRLGTGPELLVRWRAKQDFNLGISTRLMQYWPSSSETSDLKLSLRPIIRKGISQNSAWGLEGAVYESESEVQARYFYYF